MGLEISRVSPQTVRLCFTLIDQVGSPCYLLKLKIVMWFLVLTACCWLKCMARH